MHLITVAIKYQTPVYQIPLITGLLLELWGVCRGQDKLEVWCGPALTGGTHYKQELEP